MPALDVVEEPQQRAGDAEGREPERAARRVLAVGDLGADGDERPGDRQREGGVAARRAGDGAGRERRVGGGERRGQLDALAAVAGRDEIRVEQRRREDPAAVEARDVAEGPRVGPAP